MHKTRLADADRIRLVVGVQGLKLWSRSVGKPNHAIPPVSTDDSRRPIMAAIRIRTATITGIRRPRLQPRHGPSAMNLTIRSRSMASGILFQAWRASLASSLEETAAPDEFVGMFWLRTMFTHVLESLLHTPRLCPSCLDGWLSSINCQGESKPISVSACTLFAFSCQWSVQQSPKSPQTRLGLQRLGCRFAYWPG